MLTPRLLALPARLAQQGPLAFARFKEIGLVGLGNAVQCAGLALAGQLQEAVAPAKRRAPSHVQLLGHLGNAQTLIERLRIRQPFAAQVQFAQRRARQRVEGARAATAQKALQASGKAVLDEVRAAAMGAAARRLRFDGFNGGLSRLQRSQLGLQHPALAPAQLGNGLHQSMEFGLLHVQLPYVGRRLCAMHYSWGLSGWNKDPIHTFREKSQHLSTQWLNIRRDHWLSCADESTTSVNSV